MKRLALSLIFFAAFLNAQTCDPNVDFTCVNQPAPCDPAGGYVVLCSISTVSCALDARCQSGLVCVFLYAYCDVYYGVTCDSNEVISCAAPGTGRLVPNVSPEVIPALLLFHLPHHILPRRLHPVKQVDLTELQKRRWYWRKKV